MKTTIDIAVADAPSDGEIRHVGSIDGELASLGKALHIVQEAGPCGFFSSAPPQHAGLALPSDRALVDRPG